MYIYFKYYVFEILAATHDSDDIDNNNYNNNNNYHIMQ